MMLYLIRKPRPPQAMRQKPLVEFLKVVVILAADYLQVILKIYCFEASNLYAK